MSDYRVAWLHDRISKALGVQEHPESVEVFKEYHEKFQEYLDEPILDVCHMEKCIFYVYRTFYDKLVEREVLTIEKGKGKVKDLSANMSEITYCHHLYDSSSNYDSTTASYNRCLKREERQEGKR